MTPRAPLGATEGAGPALFGCADLKLGEDGSVRVLELGDGHTSGFTGAGAFLPEAFLEGGYAKGSPGPVLDAVLENKALTHDAFVAAGLEGLRPASASFPLAYSPDLAERVLAAVGRGPVVLKLCARQHGCGVVLAEAAELDAALRALLGADDEGARGDAAPAPSAAETPEAPGMASLRRLRNDETRRMYTV